MSPTTKVDTASAPSKRLGGVADYFAVLGVGEKLVLHTQKKNAIMGTFEEADDAKIEREEECALMERFYREIVEVTIVIDDDEGCDDSGDYLERNASDLGSPRGSTVSSTAPVNAPLSVNEICADAGTFDASPSSHQLPHQAIPTSPSGQSDATSAITMLDRRERDTLRERDETEQCSGTKNTEEVGGFTVVRQTVPASRGSRENDEQASHPTARSTDGGVAVAQGEDSNISWSKAQSFDANLNPLFGLRCALLASTPLSDDTFIGTTKEDTKALYNRQRKQPSVRALGQKVGSKLRDQIVPILRSGGQTIHVAHEQWQTPLAPTSSGGRKYYIGYRRRGADENNRPALADLAVYYVRIHEASILRSSPSADATLDSDREVAANDDFREDESGNVQKATAAAAFKRGLATGAGIAARVAAKGKDRIMGQQRRSIGSLGIVDDLEESSIKGIRSPAPTRKHFFPDTPADEQRAEHHSSGIMPSSGIATELVCLEELLALPDVYDEWVIPDAYQNLCLPLPAEHLPPFQAACHKKKAGKDFFREEEEATDAAKDQLRRAEKERIRAQRRMRRTFLFSHRGGNHEGSSPSSDASGMGVEAYVDGNSFLRSPSSTSSTPRHRAGQWVPPIGADERYAMPQPLASPLEQDEEWECTNAMDPEVYMPLLLGRDVPGKDGEVDEGGDGFIYFPILAIRRQRVGEEERYHEDPAIVDITISFTDRAGAPVMPRDDDEDESEEGKSDEAMGLLGKTKWSSSSSFDSVKPVGQNDNKTETTRQSPGLPLLLFRHNTPLGFADAPFATKVLDRFPWKDYKGVPLPEEELPMFCYPTGCRLYREILQDAPLGECYGFVVKNERGDSIYVSCVSFMEPLTGTKIKQLNEMSEKRRRTSLPHRFYCERRERRLQEGNGNLAQNADSFVSDMQVVDKTVGGGSMIHADGEKNRMTFEGDRDQTDATTRNEDGEIIDEGLFFTGFDEIVTFENKTICLISRYPYWTAFRRFLSHLHVLSGSTSDLPLERYISHLLLEVPVPRPGGQCVIVPLTTMSEPLTLQMPPAKDLPLLDLSYQRLFSCLDVPTIVTIVLGFLCLERKVIVMSCHPSLVLDGCELLRSLLFPFDLCAPYVPRLTEPFMSCLDFPGAIFVGIHDDGSADGLASLVRDNMPEDSAIVDLDSGEIDCSGDRYEVLKQCWGIIPCEQRALLVSEIEVLCRDAGLVPGQEPIDSTFADSTLDASLPTTLVEDFNDRGYHAREPLDDRAIRDAFLRFFCSVLGGYERYLLVPDADFLISGNEWFDAQKFLAAAPQGRAPFLGSLVTTQLFQSFIQRRTEASDVQCLLFDECLSEFHSSHVPYGRLGGDAETTIDGGEHRLLYNLLVDQCATEPDALGSDAASSSRGYGGRTIEADSDADTNVLDLSAHQHDSSSAANVMQSYNVSGEMSAASTFLINSSGDLVTAPSREGISENARYLYCVDGNPCFPQKLDLGLFLPKEPESLLAELSEVPVPILTRSDRELDEANRRRKMATSYRGLHNQSRRCLWQLPKLMGSHVLGSWLMCIPSQVSQNQLTPEQQTKYLLRGLGALRLLRSRQRITPDEAAYRAMIIACGRAGSDRRVELVKLFGLLRSDGIFPSAVTLGQYTRAIAEGFSKRSAGVPDDHFSDISDYGEDRADATKIAIDSMDGNLSLLEESGRRWRQRLQREGSKQSHANKSVDDATKHLDTETAESSSHLTSRPKSKRSWLPITCSSSFVPARNSTAGRLSGATLGKRIRKDEIRLVALWSRAASCDTCAYVPLDEEIMCGWDLHGGEQNASDVISCPRCGSSILPLLGYKELTIEAALREQKERKPSSNSASAESEERDKQTGTGMPLSSSEASNAPSPNDNKIAGRRSSGIARMQQPCTDESRPSLVADFMNLPPQVRPFVGDGPTSPTQPHVCSTTGAIDTMGFVTYLSPSRLRFLLERYVNEHGESILERERLRTLDPQVFYNLWWYSARFSLPLPLCVPLPPGDVVAGDHGHGRGRVASSLNYCAFAGWDKSIAVEGCRSGAKAMLEMASLLGHEFPLLSHFSLQAYAADDWDHSDLSEILVALVKACDTRDFRPVVDCVLQCNKRRRKKYETDGSDDISDIGMDGNLRGIQSYTEQPNELDCYHTMLYLAKYQCTTAFHVFFPATAKPCKGYHFWCATGTPLPIFDRMFRDAARRIRGKEGTFTPLQDVSDVALGFRCVFGHMV